MSWIPVTERLPRSWVEVLVTTKDENVAVAHLGAFFWDVHGYTFPTEVVAWEPLPAPYGAQDE